jgi:hypothetical protein
MLLIRGNIKAVEESLNHALILTFNNERQLMPLSHQGAGNHKVQISQLSDINIFTSSSSSRNRTAKQRYVNSYLGLVPVVGSPPF